MSFKSLSFLTAKTSKKEEVYFSHDLYLIYNFFIVISSTDTVQFELCKEIFYLTTLAAKRFFVVASRIKFS